MYIYIYISRVKAKSLFYFILFFSKRRGKVKSLKIARYLFFFFLFCSGFKIEKEKRCIKKERKKKVTILHTITSFLPESLSICRQRCAHFLYNSHM